MDYVFFSTLMTIVMLVVFVGIVIWASSSKRANAFEEAALVPFEEDAAPAKPTEEHNGKQS